MSSAFPTRTETRRRLGDAMARSRVLCVSSSRLLAVSSQARVTAARVRVDSVTRRASRIEATIDVGIQADNDVQAFVVTGHVDGHPAHASYENGLLRCSAEVAQRAQVV